jgi:hypothetical protein|eukprot:COSAG01_NODE_1535_length_9988_cov_30.249065_1_plen_161_part_00
MLSSAGHIFTYPDVSMACRVPGARAQDRTSSRRGAGNQAVDNAGSVRCGLWGSVDAIPCRKFRAVTAIPQIVYGSERNSPVHATSKPIAPAMSCLLCSLVPRSARHCQSVRLHSEDQQADCRIRRTHVNQQRVQTVARIVSPLLPPSQCYCPMLTRQPLL